MYHWKSPGGPEGSFTPASDSAWPLPRHLPFLYFSIKSLLRTLQTPQLSCGAKTDDTGNTCCYRRTETTLEHSPGLCTTVGVGCRTQHRTCSQRGPCFWVTHTVLRAWGEGAGDKCSSPCGNVRQGLRGRAEMGAGSLPSPSDKLAPNTQLLREPSVVIRVCAPPGELNVPGKGYY